MDATHMDATHMDALARILQDRPPPPTPRPTHHFRRGRGPRWMNQSRLNKSTQGVTTTTKPSPGKKWTPPIPKKPTEKILFPSHRNLQVKYMQLNERLAQVDEWLQKLMGMGYEKGFPKHLVCTEELDRFKNLAENTASLAASLMAALRQVWNDENFAEYEALMDTQVKLAAHKNEVMRLICDSQNEIRESLKEMEREVASVGSLIYTGAQGMEFLATEMMYLLTAQNAADELLKAVSAARSSYLEELELRKSEACVLFILIWVATTLILALELSVSGPDGF